MNVSPNNKPPLRRLVALAAVVSVGVGLSGLPAAAQQTWGQQGGPIRLIPPGSEAPADAPPGDWRLRDTVPRESRPAQIAPRLPREVVSGIQASDSLDAVSIDATGVLDASLGGLPVDMWSGSRRDVIGRALDALPVVAPSPVRQGLARTLLLTVASPPSGSGPALIDLRADRLVALGATPDALRLIEAVPEARITEALAKARVEALMVEGRLDEACAVAEDGIARWDAPMWQKAQAFCALRADRREQASLAVTMLREQGIDDPAFLWAAEQLSGLRGPAPSDIGRPTPLVVAMLLATGRTLPASLLDAPEPWVLRAVALSPSDATKPDVRVPAGERAALHGAFSAEDLAALYRAQTFPEDAFAQPLADIVAAPNPLTGALLFQLAERQAVPAALAEVVVRAMTLAERVGLHAATASLYAPLIERLAPAADLMWFAETAGRTLFHASRFDSAAEWYEAAANAAAVDSDARQAADGLWPLYRLAVESMSDRWPEARMKAWRTLMTTRAETASGNEPTTRRVARQQARLLSLLQATGDRVEVDDWAPLWAALPAGGGFVPQAPTWHAVSSAADQLRVGETVLFSLMVQGDAAPADVSDAALHRAVENLRVVGLEDAARRIAVEAAIAAGL